jgi:hypothetical protein
MKHIRKNHVKKQQEMKVLKNVAHSKNLCLPKPSIVVAAAERKAIHNSYFQDSKDHKIERTWRDKKENCEKLNISCGLSAKTRNEGNSYVEC